MQLRALRATAAIALSALLASAPLTVRAEAPATRPAGGPDRAAATKPTKAATKPAASASTTPSAPSTPPAPRQAQSATRPAVPAVPASAADLRAIQKRVEEVTRQVMPSVVGVDVGGSQGSGVIISPDGFVLTAAHVSGWPGRDVELILDGGRRVAARTLGTNAEIDAGLMKIVGDRQDWPHAAVGRSASLAKGQWVIALGHPGGYQRNRPPVLRLGRVSDNRGPTKFLVTDCALVGGDSGGPLFDLEGNVVGVHSRIGMSTLANMHTPADTYVATWDRLARGEAWGDRLTFITPRTPFLGIEGEGTGDGDGTGARILAVRENGPAAKAGVRAGDVVTAFDGKPVTTMAALAEMIRRKRPGDEVAFEVLRAGKKVELKAKLTRHPQMR